MTAPTVMLRLALASLFALPLTSSSPRLLLATGAAWRFKEVRRAKLDGMPLVTFEITDRMPQAAGRTTVPIPRLPLASERMRGAPKTTPSTEKLSTKH